MRAPSVRRSAASAAYIAPRQMGDDYKRLRRLVEPPGAVLAGDAAGGGLVHRAVVGEGAGHGASALSSPETTNQTSRVRLRAVKVRVIRSGGGFGEPVTGTAMVVGVELREAREQRRDVTVRAEAQQDQVELAAAVRPQLLSVRRSSGRHVGVRLVGRRHGVHPRRVGPDHVEQVQLDAAVVAVAGVGRHVALVAPPEVHLRPVHGRPESSCASGPVDLGRDGPAGQRDRGHPALCLDRCRAGRRSCSATVRARVSASATTDTSVIARRQLHQSARGRGVRVVLVEPPELLGQQLGHRPAASARPAGRAGRGRRTAPACRRRG